MRSYKHLIFSSFILKIIAMAAVLSDHIAFAFIAPSNPLYTIMRILGRLAFILFAFFLTEGIIYSRNKDAYLLRLFALYALLQVIIMVGYFFDKSLTFSNIFATLFSAGAALTYFEKKEWKKVYYLIPLAALMVVNYLFVVQNVTALEIFTGDYLFYGIAVIFGFYLARKVGVFLLAKYPRVVTDENEEINEEARLGAQVVLNAASSVSLLIITFIWYILGVFRMADLDMSLQSWALLTLPFLMLYNGKLGYNAKGFRIAYYLFFPVHLLLIALLTLLI